MERNEKLERVVAAIQQTRMLSPVGRWTLHISSDYNGLLDIDPRELREMLLKLQDCEKVIKLEKFPDAACVLASITSLKARAWEKLPKNELHCVITILDTFDKWYAKFWVETALESELNSVIEQIGCDAEGFVETLRKVGRTGATLELLRRLSPDSTSEEIDKLLDIALGMSGSPTLSMPSVKDFNRPNRKRAALSNQKVNADRAPIPIHLTLSRPILRPDSGITSGGRTSIRHEEQDLSEDEIVYSITFTATREILLNNVFQIARPDSFRENEAVFDYLYKHPNEKFTREQIEKELREPLLKSLHKIVENLGFTGILKAAFFNVIKESIQFKNPIKSGDLSPSDLSALNSLIAKG